MRLLHRLLAGLACLSGIGYGQTFRITSTTPNGQGTGALYPGDGVPFVVTAVRENITNPISAKLILREYNLDSGALIRELSFTGGESGGVYRLASSSYRIPAFTCYQSCRAGQTLRSSETKVRIELQASIDYSVQLPSGLDRRTALSAVVAVPVQYPTVTSISVSSAPMHGYVPAARITVKGAKFETGKYVNVLLLKANDHTKTLYTGSPSNPDPYEYWLLPREQQQNSSTPRVINEETIEVALNLLVGVVAFGSEAESVGHLGEYDIVVVYASDPPTGVFRSSLITYGTGLFSLTPPATDDFTKITKLEVQIDRLNPDPAKRTTAVWTPGAANTMDVAPGAYISAKLTGTYKLSRYSAGLLWLVMRDKATKRHLYMPWDFARNTAGKERDTIEQGFGRHTQLDFTYRLPDTAAELEFFLVLTPQDQQTPTNYDRAPTVPFGEAFAFSPVVNVAWSKPGDVSIDHIEVVQVVQNDKNEIPLIAGKNTVARVFLRVEPKTADAIANVSVKLTSGLGGTPRRLNGPITAVGEPDRNKLEHAVNFALPAEWIKEGELSLEAEVELPRGFTDTKPDNNKKLEKVRFVETPFKDRKFTVAYVPVCYQPKPDVERRCPEGDLNTFGSMFQLVYPLAEGRVRYARLGTKRPTVRFPLTSASSSRLMAALNKYYRIYDEKRPGVMDQLVGWIPRITDAATNANDRKIPIGRANVQRSGGTGRVAYVQDTSTSELPLRDASGNRAGTGKDTLYSHVAIAHEVGHNYGLRHPGTADSCGSQDNASDWPKNAAGNSLPATIGEAGFDTAARKVKPSTLKDMMTYCGPPGGNLWASARHYQKLLTALQTGRPSATEAGRETSSAKEAERTLAVVRRAEGDAIALVSGQARRGGVAGLLDPVIRMASATTVDASDARGNHCLVFGNDGGVLGKHCFQLNFLDQDTDEAVTDAFVDEEYFSFQVLIPAGASRVDLMAGENVLASLKAGGSAPSVSIRAPQAGERWTGGGTRTLSWTGSSADGGAVSYTAMYSNDGGATWLPLDVDVSDTQVSIDTAELDGGANVYFRVIASSGFDSAEATVGPIELTQTPKLEGPPGGFDFGHVLVGLDAEANFRLRSSGSGPVAVSGMNVTGGPGFSLVAPVDGFTLAPSDVAEVTLRFEATEAGVVNGVASIESSDPATPVMRVPVRARAVESYIPEIAVSPSTLDFGTVNAGQQRELTLTVQNVGSATLNVSSIGSSHASVTATGTTRFALEPGAQRAVAVQLRASTAGALTGSVTVTSDDPDRPSVSIALAGRVGAAGGIGVSPASLEFGNVAVGSNRELAVTVSNTGAAELSISSVASSNGRFAVISPAGAFRVAAGGQQAVTVRFSPTTAQVENGTLTIGSVSVALSGTGTAVAGQAPVLTAPASLDFGAGVVGQAKDGAVTLRNSGTANLVITALTVSGAQFAIVGGPALPLTLAAGAQQTLNLRMTPAAAGTQTGELRVASNDPARPTTVVSLIGNATAGTGTGLEVSPNPLAFGDVAVGQNRTLVMTVRNAGTAAVTVASISSSNPVFTLQGAVFPATLAGGASAAFNLRFAPMAVGAQTATITVSSGTTVSLAASGNGVAASGTRTVTLQVDDGTFETGIGLTGGAPSITFVNRLTPAAYPATIRRVEIYFGADADELPIGHPVTVLVGTNTSGSSNINGIAFQRTDTAVAVRPGFNSLTLQTPVTLQSGDFVVGFTTRNPVNVFPMAADNTPPLRQRSYVSTDGVAFVLVDTISRDLASNFAIRAVVDVPSQ
ncbi:MAG: choice-of-anchor D domain-containing protein [Bryobacteraceae bacterium]